MHNLPQPVRLYYLCSVFRYERPQSGRYRQHNQFGIEVFGDGDASIDAEVIEMGWRFLESIGLGDLSLVVNSTGDPQCRPAYIETLATHYQGHVDRLCPDCKRRLERNPLRLLDCKQESCQPVIAEAPHSVDYLCDECEQHWGHLLTYLGEIGLDYEVDHRLVRGFDYYTRTVFEITPPIEGRQSTLVGGGRYDGLIQELGGRPTPGVGFGMGVERVLANLKRQEVPLPDRGGTKVLVAHVGEAGKLEAMTLAKEFRRGGVAAILAPSNRSLKSQLRYASSVKSTHAVIVGDDEIRKGVVVLRDLNKGEQREIANKIDELTKALPEQPGNTRR
jgi:histidyl-tRNA synthetase